MYLGPIDKTKITYIVDNKTGMKLVDIIGKCLVLQSKNYKS